MVQVEAGVKRKRPPTFQHLPINRAKKLKQTWVETAKIRSKWKAEKRKAGLSQEAASIPRGEEEGARNDGEEEGEQSDFESKAQEDPPPPRPTTSFMHPSRVHRHETKTKTNIQPTVQSKGITDVPNHSTSSLRDLTREAYSRSSLHTFKSDPLNRRRGSSAGGGRREDRGKGKKGQSGGQPNMKLRMDAMLEKIKRDFA